MARYDVPIRAIGENVERLAGEDVRKRVMEGSEQITDSSSLEEVARWVKGAAAGARECKSAIHLETTDQ